MTIQQRINELEKDFDNVVDEQKKVAQDSPRWLLLAIKKGQIVAELKGLRFKAGGDCYDVCSFQDKCTLYQDSLCNQKSCADFNKEVNC